MQKINLHKKKRSSVALESGSKSARGDSNNNLGANMQRRRSLGNALRPRNSHPSITKNTNVTKKPRTPTEKRPPAGGNRERRPINKKGMGGGGGNGVIMSGPGKSRSVNGNGGPKVRRRSSLTKAFCSVGGSQASSSSSASSAPLPSKSSVESLKEGPEGEGDSSRAQVLRLENERLMKALSERENTITQLSSTKRRLSQGHVKDCLTISGLRAQIKTLRKKLKEAQERSETALTTTNSPVVAAVSPLLAPAESSESKNSEDDAKREAVIEKMEAEIKQLETKVKAAEQRWNESVAKQTTLEHENHTLHQDLEKEKEAGKVLRTRERLVMKRSEELSRDVVALQGSLDEAHQKISTLEKHANESAAFSKRQNESVEQIRASIEEEKKRASMAAKEAKMAQEETRSLRRRSDAAETSMAALRSQCEHLQNEKALVQTQLTALQAELSKEKENNAISQKKQSAKESVVQETVETLRKELSRTSHALSEKSMRIKELDTTIVTLRSQKSTAEQRLRISEADLRESACALERQTEQHEREKKRMEAEFEGKLRAGEEASRAAAERSRRRSITEAASEAAVAAANATAEARREEGTRTRKLKTQLEKLRKENEALRKETATAKEDARKAKRDLQLTRVELDQRVDQQLEVAKHHKLLKSLEDDLKSKETEIGRLQGELREAMRAVIKARDDASANAKTSAIKMDALRKEALDVKKEKGKLEGQLETLSKQHGMELEATMEETRSHVERLSDTIAEHVTEIATLKKELATLKSGIAQRNARDSAMKGMEEDVRKKLLEYEKKIGQYKSKLATAKDSFRLQQQQQQQDQQKEQKEQKEQSSQKPKRRLQNTEKQTNDKSNLKKDEASERAAAVADAVAKQAAAAAQAAKQSRALRDAQMALERRDTKIATLKKEVAEMKAELRELVEAVDAVPEMISEECAASGYLANLKVLLKSAEVVNTEAVAEYQQSQITQLKETVQVMVFNISTSEKQLARFDSDLAAKQRRVRERTLEELKWKVEKEAKSNAVFQKASMQNMKDLSKKKPGAIDRLTKARKNRKMIMKAMVQTVEKSKQRLGIEKKKKHATSKESKVSFPPSSSSSSSSSARPTLERERRGTEKDFPQARRRSRGSISSKDSSSSSESAAMTGKRRNSVGVRGERGAVRGARVDERMASRVPEDGAGSVGDKGVMESRKRGNGRGIPNSNVNSLSRGGLGGRKESGGNPRRGSNSHGMMASRGARRNAAKKMGRGLK